MLGPIKVAEGHGSPSQAHPGQVLAAFKTAAPYLGIRPNIVHAIDWLFRFTNPQDWQASSRPIVWPSAALQREEFGLGPSQIKNVNRQLIELGLVVMKDSPNGKRYGRRDPQGRIVEAYGFDLSPLATRLSEFRAAAEAGRAERANIQALKRRATVARNGIRQLLHTATEHEIATEAWTQLQDAASAASRGVARIGQSAEMEMVVSRLERIQGDMRRHLEDALKAVMRPTATRGSPVNNDPKEPTDWPHITTTNNPNNPKDTVVASEERNVEHRPGTSSKPLTKEIVHSKPKSLTTKPAHSDPGRSATDTLLKLTPAGLLKLAPRLQGYLRSTSPRWPDVVEAATWLRDELNIPQFTWGEACIALGREQAAIALAIVSAKPPGHFRESAGAYFQGMVSRAKAGDLHLARTIWAMQHRPPENRDQVTRRKHGTPRPTGTTGSRGGWTTAPPIEYDSCRDSPYPNLLPG
jgi:replication initiation protein RepC